MANDNAPGNQTPHLNQSYMRTRPSFSKVTDWLQENQRIGYYFSKPRGHRRFATLKLQQMFDSLFNLYRDFFHSNWNRFNQLVTSYERDYQNNRYYAQDPMGYAAAVYVSSWIHDVYVMNRLATRAVWAEAYSGHYRLDVTYYSTKYDAYLAVLGSHIRPTNIKFTHEDTVFVPQFGTTTLNLEAEEENVFSIDGWAVNLPLLFGLLQAMTEGKFVRMDDLSDHHHFGRPSWLFDWHGDQDQDQDHNAYAWFPSQENYNMDDVTVAYILGVACTPSLGPKDYDEWQTFPHNVVPANIQTRTLNRVRELTYFAAEIYDEIEIASRSIDSDYSRSIRQQLYLHLILNPIISMVTKAKEPATQVSKASKIKPAKKTRMSSRASSMAQEDNKDEESHSKTPSVQDAPEQEAESKIGEDTAGPFNLIRFVNELQFPQLNQFRFVSHLYHSRVTNKVEYKTRYQSLRMFHSPSSV